MVKPLRLVALLANIILFVFTGSSSSNSVSSSTSSSSTSQQVSSSSSSGATAVAHRRHKTHGYPSTVCRLNEVWSTCPIAVCSPKTCDDVGFPIACPDLRPGSLCPVKPECICKEGYVKNFGGICIPMKHCPTCGGDPNAVSGSGNHCNNLCCNYDQKPAKCEPLYFYNACDCRPGFVFDEIKRRCVFPFECSRLNCKKNEVYDPCPPAYPLRICGINDTAVSYTPALQPGHPDCAAPECRCKDGYYRNDVGKCVRWKNCPVCKGLNEIYDPCPAPCPPQYCGVNIALILCQVPPQLGDPECQPGCRCIDNYVRNQTGVCIPRDQCPTCPNINEVYDPCIAPCPPRRCDVDERLIKCAAPPQVGDPSCEAGCRCDDGYYRNSQGVCVTRDQCPPICNGQHEVYNDCIQGQCNPKNCSQLGFPVPCPRIDPRFCIGGCLCEEDYARDEYNVCIHKTECPSCGGDPNAVAGCGNCKKRCSDIGKEPIFCTEICYENACDCREGLLYDDNTMKCVPPDQCTQTCGPDEIYNECIQAYCGPKNCSQLGFPIACPKIDPKYCKKGCLCKNGYVRDCNGVCIPIKQCPSCGGDPNAETGCSNHCGNMCSDYNKKNIACSLACLVNGCACRKGFVYDSNTRKCVLPKQCTPVCKNDEVYSDCVNNPCPVQNCSLVGIAVNCVNLDPKDCIKGCLCKSPLMREDDGSCVPIGDCKPRCNKPNEYYEPCDYDCPPRTCESLDRIYICPIERNSTCKGQCKCKERFYRNTNGDCITEEQCRKCMGPHEYYSCGGACDNVCATLHRQNQTNCPIVNIKCNEMCYCETGYARAKNGTCIPIDQCKVCNKNEVYSECINGGCTAKNCSQIGLPIPCIKLDPKYCISGCLCKPGYLRDENGICVPEKDCKPRCDKPNEYYEPCDYDCPPRTCESLDRAYACPIKADDICKGQCKCKQGFYRNLNGECITEEQCRKCMCPHEYYSCGGACDNVCATLHRQNQTNCPIVNIKCNEMCYCEKGYARNKNGTCIPIEQCKVCNKNEVYSECINGGCTAKNCSQLGLPIPCIKLDPKYCISGCLCKPGYLRDENGICVPEKDCKPRCDKPNEYYEPCDYDCPPRTCESLDRAYVCPIKEDDICKGQCKCKDGFYRNINGECITEKQCRMCMGPHEYYSCGGACDNVCATLHRQNQTNCPIVNIKCNEMCYCEKGYARAQNGTCILIDQCKVCGPDEIYNECVQGHCYPKNCSQLGFLIPCPKIDPNDCETGCLCKSGYLRDKNRVCIPTKQCPSCGGDPNAEPGCSNHCGNQCSDYYKENVKCPLACIFNGCKCRKGYVYDTFKKLCVLPKDCTNICTGKHEIFENCTNPTCRPKNCSEIGFSLNCTDPPACKKGCICDYGYVKDYQGNCIPLEQCPSCGGDPNAHSGCGIYCGTKCEDLGKEPGACIALCIENACDCNEGHYYDDQKKKCVLPSECTKICTGKHEIYENCTNPTCRPKKCSEVGYPLNCTDPPACSKGCVCDNGYVRDDKGNCIPIKNCSSCGGDPNAHSGCGIYCGTKCEDLGKEPGACIALCKENACDCNEGHYFDDEKKKCVLPSECTKICAGKHEVYENCTNPTCRPKKCSEVGFPLNCTHPPACNKGCVCDNGYVRNVKGKCIPIKKCPSCGGDPNAQPGCGIYCGTKCEDLYKKPGPCILLCKENACDCKKGYYYDKIKKKCVRPSQCPNVCTGKHEVYDNCTNPTCRPKKCSEVGFSLNCTDPPACTKGCVCDSGYVRDKHDNCIPIKQCPACGGDKNAESGCGVNCLKKCYDLQHPNNPRPCSKICKVNSCDCKEGFYYDEITKTCVCAGDCTPNCGKNEFVDPCANDGCTIKNCSQLGSTPMPAIDKKDCKPGCTCKEGYIRSDKGICIPIEKCPKYPKCGKHEMFVLCPPASCGPQRCDQLGYPLDCSISADECCPEPPGCICKDDYVRNKTGKCIPKRECPSCGGDVNAWSGCGVNCGKKCEDLIRKNLICPKICKFNSCDCRDGFYLDKNIDKCVTAEKCSPTCSENEVYDSCVNGGCGHRNCSQLNGPVLCIDPLKCIGGCTCKKGYLRLDETGICVPVNQCPEVCNKPNEEYVKCPPNCPPQTCESLNRTYHCPLIKVKINESDCVGECRCKEGYYRNLIKECISKEDCLKCTGAHEYYSCGPPCDNVCCELDTQSKDNCPIMSKKCVSMCYCEDGYARNDDGVCVCIKECPGRSSDEPTPT